MVLSMYNSIVIHYSEIGTKGGNRKYFENRLMDNIRNAIGLKVYKRYGRVICVMKKSKKPANLNQIKKKLEVIPGIAYFSFAVKTRLSMTDIKKKSLAVLKDEKFKSFRIRTRRSNKKFKLTSMEIDRDVGAVVYKKMKKKVKLEKPGKTVFIEIGEKEAFVYSNKHKGIGGLPAGTGGKVVCSLSGGIDSPVASFMVMKRGCKVVFVHFYSQTASEKSLSKIQSIVKQLANIQGRSKLYIVPFENIQNEIIKKIPSKSRMIIYRRFMTRIINEIAKKGKSLGIITGDSIGQVASQTIENINCIYEASELPILSPLIGMNKEEIVDIAKQIKSYKYSIIPYPDCCSFLIAKHPETRANIKHILKIEKTIKNRNKLVNDALKSAKIEKF